MFVAVQEADAKKTKKKPKRHGTGERVNRMSDDLISRKAVLDILFEARIRDTLLASPTFIETLRRRIKELPTAFDKGSVIEDLEALEETESLNMNDDVAMAYAYALAIVEKGGIK